VFVLGIPPEADSTKMYFVNSGTILLVEETTITQRPEPLDSPGYSRVLYLPG
jgi:hypothetical protein